MSRMLERFYADDRGQDLIEYALLASLLAVVSVAGLQLLGPKISDLFLKLRKAI
jgi:Flp pilus assembly pilin Flp